MANKQELPERQRKILEFLGQYVSENRYPPTVREIGEAIGVPSTSLVSYYLKRLEELGYIARDAAISRGIRILDEEIAAMAQPDSEREQVSIPHLGYIVAGIPIPTEALAGDETLELSRALFGRDTNDLFALDVRGNSMIDALVNDGDVVIMRHQERVENGEMAAVWIDEPGETTLKKVYYEGEKVRLQPANPLMGPIYVDAGNLRVQGKVVMVIRKLE